VKAPLSTTPAEAGETVFDKAVRADDLVEFLKDLSGASLRDLCGWLARGGWISGIPGRVHSFAIYEAYQRFLKGGSK
jgi:hypothetical protein